MQFAKESVHDNGRGQADPRPLRQKFAESAFLQDFRETAAGATRGCIVLERPDLLQELVARHGATDTTARHSALVELQQMLPRPSQYSPGEEVPEKNFFYRFAKRHFFNDFGAYKSLKKVDVAPQATTADVVGRI